MKAYIKATSVVVSVAGLLVGTHAIAITQAPLIHASLEKDLVKICEALQSNNKLKLKRTIQNAGIDRKTAAKDLLCNGMSPVDFALSSKANTTAMFLAKYSRLRHTQLAKKN